MARNVYTTTTGDSTAKAREHLHNVAQVHAAAHRAAQKARTLGRIDSQIRVEEGRIQAFEAKAGRTASSTRYAKLDRLTDLRETAEVTLSRRPAKRR